MAKTADDKAAAKAERDAKKAAKVAAKSPAPAYHTDHVERTGREDSVPMTVSRGGN